MNLFIIFIIFLFISYVHRNISMRILECPPSGEEGYVDEADQFYLNPSSWLQKEFGNHTGHGDPAHLPSHIVMYNVLSPVSHFTVFNTLLLSLTKGMLDRVC